MTLHKAVAAVAAIASLLALCAGVATAQFQLQRGRDYETGWTNSILRPQVQKELELVDEQLEKVNEIRADHSKSQQELYRQLYKGGQLDALTREVLYEKRAELREKMADQLAEVLLPHQLKRAREIWLQTQITRLGTSGAFSNPSIRELLEISPEQYQQLARKSVELNTELMEKYQQLKAQAAEELLEELTPQQRKKLQELSGEDYEPVQIDYRKYYEQQRAARQKMEEEKRADGRK